MNTMKRFGAFVLPVVLLVAAGCAEDQTPRSYVQANAVQKSLFGGEWYYRTCVIRTDYESGDMAFPGDCSADWINYSGGVQVPRIRWMIDRDYLIAMRSYEYVEGSNVENRPYIGEPVLAFKILSHFDIRRDYNPTTGEEVNVIVENDFDRHWSLRDYIRVDWSENLILTMDVFTAALYDAFSLYTREAAPSFIQEGSDSVGVQWPDSYRPRFLRTSAVEDTYDGVSRVGEYGGEGQLYYMDFVTNEVFTPGNVPDPYTGQSVPWCMSVYIDAPICTASLITLRNSFLKVPPNDDYEAQEWPDSRFDQFGFWRLGRPTYDVGDRIDPTDPNFGMTDFWTYPIGRINIWQQSTNAAGNRIPPVDRQVRPTYFYMTNDTPLHLLRPAVRIVADWNRFYMKTVRVLQGRALPAWDDGSTDDKDWIFDPETGGAYQCTGGPNIFGECPLGARSTTASDRYDCRMAIDSRDTGLNVPASLEPYKAFDPNVRWDTDFDADRYVAMEGDECVIVGRVNSCVRHPAGRDGPNDPGEPCEERGDLRYSFISYVNDASTGWSGVAEMRSDPITGKYVAGDVNVGGDQLDLWRTRVLTEIDLETGVITEEEYFMGEMYRDYVANLGGNVDRPATPQRELPPITAEGATVMGVPLSAMKQNMERAFVRAEQLKGERGRANIYSDRVRNLVGTDIERLLFDNEEMLAANDINMLRPGVTAPSEQRLELGSHFRKSLPQRVAEWQRMETRRNRGDIMRPPVFIDASVTGFVNKLTTDFPGILDRRPQLTFLLDAYLYIPLMEHEYGHLLGLRHNFGGSADPANFFPKYYDIVDANPMPDENDPAFDTNGDGHLDALELAGFADAQTQVRQDRELAGIKIYQTAAVMEYAGNWYDELAGLPSYDPAALMFGYGDVVEVWERTGAETPIPGRNAVHYWKYYHGGEPCSSDSDCPFGAGGAQYGELKAEQVTYGAVQTCTSWNTVAGVTQACSNFRQDVARLATAGGQFIDRKYKFCTDDQTGYRGDCSTFDEGGSYREIVHNLRDYWERNYLRFNFRRYRYTFDYYPYISGFMRFYNTAQKIFQEMFSKWAADLNNYRGDTGAFGFYDQYMASVDILNWFIQTLALPNVGSYRHIAWQDRYTWENRFLDAENTDLNIPLGTGKYTYSIYQGGMDGINRVERIGSLYDKIWTLELMLVRNWGYGYTLDEPYFVNMYDLFPTEIGHLMTGLIADEPGYYMPRVLEPGREGTDTRIIYPNFWNGACLADATGTSPCWNEDPSLSALSPLESASFYVQMLGVTYGLSEIPTPFDPTFQEQAQVYVVGSGGGARVPPDARACPLTSTTDCDYSVFTSRRFHRQYLAFKVEGDARGMGGEASLGFSIVQKAATQQAALDCCEQCLVDSGGEWGGDCEDPTGGPRCENAKLCAQARCGIEAAQFPDALQWFRQNVDSYESFIRYLLELQGRYGLNTWITYNGSLGK